MKINLIKNTNNNKFCKLIYSCISLIILIITIIVDTLCNVWYNIIV